VRLIDGIRIDLKRSPYIRRIEELRWIEVRGHHADHNVWISAQRNRLSDDAAIGCETTRPPSIRKDSDTRSVRTIFLRREGASNQCCPAKEVKERRADLPRVHLLGKV